MSIVDAPKITDYDFLENNYNQKKSARQALGKIGFCSETKYPELVDKLIEDGVSRFPFLLEDNADMIFKKMDSLLSTGSQVRSGRDLSSFSTTDLDSYKKIPQDLISQGPKFYRNITDNIRIRNPFLAIPEIFEIATDDRIISVVQDYYGVLPAITYVKLVRNFANNIPQFNSQFWHIDTVACKMLKVFIYLNDVDDLTGPTCFVKSSHKEKIKRHMWKSASTYGDLTDDSVIKKFGKDSIIKNIGKKGSVFFVDTSGIHKALKPVKSDRSVLILNYCIHEEYAFDYQKEEHGYISKEQYESLDHEKKPIANLLKVR